MERGRGCLGEQEEGGWGGAGRVRDDLTQGVKQGGSCGEEKGLGKGELERKEGGRRGKEEKDEGEVIRESLASLAFAYANMALWERGGVGVRGVNPGGPSAR